MKRAEMQQLRKGDRIVLAGQVAVDRGTVEDYDDRNVWVTWDDGGHGILRVMDDERITRDFS